MSRIVRSQLMYKGCFAHVISRSIRKLKLFHDAEDFLYFKDLLIRAKEKAKFELFHYCLMQTHFHLAVKIGGLKDFSLAIRDVKRDYAYRFHTKYKLSGPIWRERYKSLLIENEQYLYACGEYIEENSVKAGLVAKAKDWPYSSKRFYELKEEDKLIDMYNEEIKKIEIKQMDYEKGNLIGSDFFIFRYLRNIRKSRPVPLE